MPDEAAINRYAEAMHEVRTERRKEVEDRPSFSPEPWADRPGYLKEIDRSMASVVATLAIHDAGEDVITMRGQLLAARVERNKATTAEADRIVAIARRLLDQMHPVGSTGMVDAVPFDTLIAMIRNRTQPEPPDGA